MPKATIYIYDQIGEYGISANDFVQTLQSLKDQGADEFDIHISSPGGSVSEGIAIYNLLTQEKCSVYIDSIAGSIASVIAMAGDKVYMHKNALMMVHNPWTWVRGDEKDLEKNQEVLKLWKESIIKAYQGKTGLSEGELKDLMDDETWFRADEAVEKGFADEVITTADVTKDFVMMFASMENTKTKPKRRRSKKMNKELLMFLGFTEDEITAGVKDEDVNAKLAALKKDLGLDENATLQQVITKATEIATAPVERDEEGDEVNAKLLARIEALESQGSVNQKDRAEALVTAAVNDGKILPADKDIYLKNAELDFDGTKKILDAKTKNSAVPVKVEVKDPEKKEKGTMSDRTKAATDFFKDQGRVLTPEAKS